MTGRTSWWVMPLPAVIRWIRPDLPWVSLSSWQWWER